MTELTELPIRHCQDCEAQLNRRKRPSGLWETPKEFKARKRCGECYPVRIRLGQMQRRKHLEEQHQTATRVIQSWRLNPRACS